MCLFVFTCSCVLKNVVQTLRVSVFVLYVSVVCVWYCVLVCDGPYEFVFCICVWCFACLSLIRCWCTCIVGFAILCLTVCVIPWVYVYVFVRC